MERKEIINNSAESKLIKEIEKEIQARSAHMKQEIKELSQNVRRELNNSEYDIDPSKPILEQDTENYKKILKHIMETGEIKVSEIVKKFDIGYIKAVFIIEDLKNNNYIKFNKDTAKYDTITAEQFRKVFPN